ncbi:MAG: hypothetical protein ACOY33_01925 [Pseudomonadota bacterium]
MHGYPRGFPRTLAIAFAVLAASGLLLVPGLLYARLGQEDIAWRAAGELRLWLTGTHVFAGYLWVALLGALWSRHMRNGWLVPQRRLSGGAQAACALVLVLSALVVLYAGEDRTALVAALVHLAAGALATAVIVQHVASARRAPDERRSGLDRRG